MIWRISAAATSSIPQGAAYFVFSKMALHECENGVLFVDEFFGWVH
jgi:hypothetical protein